MPFQSKSLQLKIVIGIMLGVVAVAFAAIVRTDTGIAQTSNISADQAVVLALSYAKDNGLWGGMVGQPTEIRGRIMPFGQARQFLLSPIDPNTVMYTMRDNPVWLIMLRGNFIGHIQAFPGLPSKNLPSNPGRDDLHSQMAVIIDANTGDGIADVLVPLGKELSVISLPVLNRPTGSISLPTRLPIVPVTPVAPATPAPLHP